jgi:hypothetical protein
MLGLHTLGQRDIVFILALHVCCALRWFAEHGLSMSIRGDTQPSTCYPLLTQP